MMSDRASPAIAFRLLGTGDGDVLAGAADGVFDHPIDHGSAEAFMAHPRLHVAVAMCEERVVGFASAVDYGHADQPRELWINDIAVAPDYRHAGVGAGVIKALLTKAVEIGCVEAWVLADADNAAANALYQSVGGQAERPGQFAFALRKPSSVSTQPSGKLATSS